MILCAGEALIDMMPGTTDAGEPAFVPHAGGSVFNTALALGRLGVPTGYLGGLSTDPFGVLLGRTLREANVDTDRAPHNDRLTTLAMVHLADGQATYAFYDEGTAGRMLAAEELPGDSQGASAVFVGGISLVAEPCGTAFEAFATRAARDAVLMVDPNIRPDFITDEPGYRERLARLFAIADIVKLSAEDLTWIFGPGHISDRAGLVLASGPKLVFVTDGGRGARGYTAHHEVILKAEAVDVVDTVAAGDAFNAGILAELSRAGLLDKAVIPELSHDAIESALSLANRVAAITVSRRGANPPWADEI